MTQSLDEIAVAVRLNLNERYSSARPRCDHLECDYWFQQWTVRWLSWNRFVLEAHWGNSMPLVNVGWRLVPVGVLEKYESLVNDAIDYKRRFKAMQLQEVSPRMCAEKISADIKALIMPSYEVRHLIESGALDEDFRYVWEDIEPVLQYKLLLQINGLAAPHPDMRATWVSDAEAIRKVWVESGAKLVDYPFRKAVDQCNDTVKGGD